MPIFKEAEIKKMLGFVTGGNMSLSRFTELLNIKSYKFILKKEGNISIIDLINFLEIFLINNDETLKSDIFVIAPNVHGLCVCCVKINQNIKLNTKNYRL